MATAKSPSADYGDDFVEEERASTRLPDSRVDDHDETMRSKRGESSPSPRVKGREEEKVDEGFDTRRPSLPTEISTPRCNAFALAIKGDVKQLLKLLESGVISLGVKDHHGWSLLHWASSKGHLEVVKALIREAAEHSGGDAEDGDEVSLSEFLNAKDQLNGWTALHCACISGHLQVIRALLVAGADPSVKDKVGDFPVDCLPLQGKRTQRMQAWLTGEEDPRDDENDHHEGKTRD